MDSACFACCVKRRHTGGFSGVLVENINSVVQNRSVTWFEPRCDEQGGLCSNYALPRTGHALCVFLLSAFVFTKKERKKCNQYLKRKSSNKKQHGANSQTIVLFKVCLGLKLPSMFKMLHTTADREELIV